MTKMSEIAQLYKKVHNKDLDEGVDDVVVPFVRGAGKGARSVDDLVKGAKSGENITDDMLKGLTKRDIDSFKYQTKDITPPAPVAAEPPKFQSGADKATDITPAPVAAEPPKFQSGADKATDIKPLPPVKTPEVKPLKEPAGGDSMVRKKEAISPDEALDQLKAGERPQDVSNRLRNTVRTTMNPDAGKFRQSEIDSMSKFDKFKDVAKKVVPPLAVAGTTAALLSRDTTDRDRQDAGAAEPATPTPAPTPEQSTKVKIASGDTLSALALKNKVSVADIAKANPELKDIHKINVGQEIVMPKATGNKIYKYGVGTASGPKSSTQIKSLLQKQENRDRVNESLLAAFNEVVSSKSDNLFAEAKKKEKKADKDYDKDGKVESAKDEVWGSRLKAAKESGKLKEETLDEVTGVVGPATKKYKNTYDVPQSAVDTASDFTRGVWSGLGGDLAKAAVDYSVKNLGSKVGLGQGTTWEKEWKQEEEKSDRAYERSPLAYTTGEVGGTVAGVASLPTLGVKGAVKGVQLGAKYAPKLIGAAARETPVLDKVLKGAGKVHDVADKMAYPAAAGAMGAHLATAEKDDFRGQGPVLTNTRAAVDKMIGEPVRWVAKKFQKEEAAGSEPKTEKEKKLAALAEPKDKITHKDVLVGRGVVKEEGFSEAELAHIASIVEGMPIAPTPEDYAPSPTDKSKRDGSKAKGSLVSEVKSADEKEEKAESKSIKGTANELHMNAKRAADNMSNVKHKFASGETVNMTKGMAVSFLNRHSAAKTADDKDAILNHANKSLDAFKHIAQGGAVPKETAEPKIKLGSMKSK